jgi:hypothetical protein
MKNFPLKTFKIATSPFFSRKIFSKLLNKLITERGWVACGKNQKHDEQCVTCSNMRGSSIKEKRRERKSHFDSHAVYFQKTNPLRLEKMISCRGLSDILRRKFYFWFLFFLLSFFSYACSEIYKNCNGTACATLGSFWNIFSS